MKIFRILKQVLKSSAGMLGGFTFGNIVWMSLFHLKHAYNLSLPSSYLLFFTCTFSFAILGIFKSSFFMSYALTILSFFGSDSDSSALDSDVDSYTDFFSAISYISGLIAITIGLLFSIKALFGIGLILIVYFSFQVYRYVQTQS